MAPLSTAAKIEIAGKAPGQSKLVEFKMPKAVLTMRTKLEGLGKEICAASLKDIPAKEYNVLCQSFRSKMSAETKNKYDTLTNNEERRRWVAQYCIDPEGAISHGLQETEVSSESSTKGWSGWITEAQLGGPKFLNDPEAAKAMIDAKELQEQDHWHESIRKKGKKVYFWNEAWGETKDALRESSKIQTKVDLKAAEAQQVAEHMVKNFGTPAAKRKAPVSKAAEDPAKKRRRELITSRSAKLRSMKTTLDRVHNELNTLEGDLAKLKTKGYPEQMQQWCKNKIQSIRDELWKTANEKYATEAMRAITDQESMEELEATVSAWDKELQHFVTSWADWKKEGGAEIKKLVD